MDIGWIAPMEPVSTGKPFDDMRFIYQVKWDGIRILSYLTDKGCSLYTRKGNSRNGIYPELAALREYFKGDSAVFDGEVVVFGEKGIPSFNRVLRRDLAAHAAKELQLKYPVVYVVFDLIFLNGRLLTALPLTIRQELLSKNLKTVGNIIICDSYEKGTDLFKTMEQKGMEGIVAKEKDGLYHPGFKHKTWLKIKCRRQLEAAVGGVVLENGRISSLLLGTWQEGVLIYIGSAGTGLDNEDLYQLGKVIKEFRSEKCPFQQRPKIGRALQTIWLPPFLHASVEYQEWSENGLLRQPVIKEISVEKV